MTKDSITKDAKWRRVTAGHYVFEAPRLVTLGDGRQVTAPVEQATVHRYEKRWYAADQGGRRWFGTFAEAKAAVEAVDYDAVEDQL
jgi:hypothetical protein